MKVLWITNIVLPEAIQMLTGTGELKTSGGWLMGAAGALLQDDTMDLSVASVSSLVKSLTILKGQRITHYLIPIGKGNERVNPEYRKYWEQVETECCPDVVHIHGTEYSHGHAYMKTFGSDNVLISIQGLTSAAAYYYYYGMSKRDIFCNLTFRDFVKGTILHGQKDFKRRSKYEIEMIKMAKHVSGRTSWDRSHIWAINPKAEYHFCNETLRADFYKGDCWNYEKCKKHSIFLSQAGYPIKGLHQMLKAMPFILRHFPDATIRVAGSDITKCSNLHELLRYGGYGRYIKRLIRELNIQGKVFFTGNLNGEEMKHEYLNANVFVCPSSIENSPNSLGEAQILGTPCVASYTGGIMDMMKGNEENLYRFEEIAMLAEKVCRIFRDESRQVDMRAIAVARHNPEANAEMLFKIYKQVSK